MSLILEKVFQSHSVAKGWITLENQKDKIGYRLVRKGGLDLLFLFEKSNQNTLKKYIQRATAQVVMHLMNSKKITDVDKIKYFIQDESGLVEKEVFVVFHYFRSMDQDGKMVVFDYSSSIKKMEDVDDSDSTWRALFLLG